MLKYRFCVSQNTDFVSHRPTYKFIPAVLGAVSCGNRRVYLKFYVKIIWRVFKILSRCYKTCILT